MTGSTEVLSKGLSNAKERPFYADNPEPADSSYIARRTIRVATMSGLTAALMAGRPPFLSCWLDEETLIELQRAIPNFLLVQAPEATQN